MGLEREKGGDLREKYGLGVGVGRLREERSAGSSVFFFFLIINNNLLL